MPGIITTDAGTVIVMRGMLMRLVKSAPSKPTTRAPINAANWGCNPASAHTRRTMLATVPIRVAVIAMRREELNKIANPAIPTIVAPVASRYHKRFGVAGSGGRGCNPVISDTAVAAMVAVQITVVA